MVQLRHLLQHAFYGYRTGPRSESTNAGTVCVYQPPESALGSGISTFRPAFVSVVLERRISYRLLCVSPNSWRKGDSLLLHVPPMSTISLGPRKSTGNRLFAESTRDHMRQAKVPPSYATENHALCDLMIRNPC